MQRTLENISQLNARTLTVNFTTGAGAAAVPSTVEWRIKCVDNDSTLQDWTSASTSTVTDAGGNTVECEAEITLSALLHDMETSKAKEQRALIVAADRGLSTEYSQEFVYYVERLKARS